MGRTVSFAPGRHHYLRGNPCGALIVLLLFGLFAAPASALPGANPGARGPQRFRSQPRREGTITRRMTRPGTYRLVWTIHTPGMRMTLKVRR